MTITNILCPTDFSEASEHAVDLAVAIAAASHARLAAIHVTRAMPIPSGVGTPGGYSLDDAEMATLRRKTAACFSAAATPVKTVKQRLFECGKMGVQFASVLYVNCQFRGQG